MSGRADAPPGVKWLLPETIDTYNVNTATHLKI